VSPQPAVAALTARLEEQAGVLAALREEVAELRALVGRSQREVLRRLEELQVSAGPVGWPAVSPAPVGPLDAGSGDATLDTQTELPGIAANDLQAGLQQRMGGADYARLVTRIRALVRTVVPGDAVVAVVSRGDDALIDLDGRLGWHFPRCDDGRYAGWYPKDSPAAIDHLEEVRRRGARYLLFPATTLWWLDYYEGLRRHLEQRYRLVVRRNDACVIYALNSQEVAT